MRYLLLSLVLTLSSGASVGARQTTTSFKWPHGKQAAVSLSFDDARASQVDVGTALFDRYGIKVTFYVVPASVERRLAGWKKAVTNGHEIGNHSLNHPCSGNFPWARPNALEEYTLGKMHGELVEANRRISGLLGVVSETFAYPCGQTFVGRGFDTRSYVPLVAGLFIAGRGWMGEGPNDPSFCDLAQVAGMEMDGKDFEEILPVLKGAQESGQWVVLAGHEIGSGRQQTTRVSMLEKLLEYVRNPAHKLWVAPVGEVAKYIRGQRSNSR
jgi:peptidoglycan/xylan/chitin deacetylase (PgdA/CDA1 family)